MSLYESALDSETGNEQAFRLCQEALARNPSLGLAHEVLGNLYSRVGLHQRGDPLEHYRIAALVDPACDLAMEQVSRDHMEHGRVKDAFELLEKAVAADTVIETVYAYLAVLYQMKREWEKADWANRRANELAPDRVLSTDFKNKILRACGYDL